MSFLNKSYSYVKHENFDDWLRSVGLPEDKVSAILSEKPTQKIVQQGDNYIITQSSPKGNKDTTFKSGVEFDDTIGDDKTPIKTTYTVSGNTVTQTIKSPLGTATFKREYNGDDLVVIKTTYTVSGNTITQNIKSPRGAATFTREFNGDDLVVTITSDNYDGVAKRYYKA